MRTIAMLIVLALLSTTTVGQTIVVSEDVTKIRQFVAKQPIGKKLYVYPKTTSYRIGILAKIDAESFEITVGKRTEKFAYSAVAGVAEAQDPKGTTSEKKTFWKRVGRGLQTGFAIAVIGTFILASYPTTLLSEQGTKVKARSLKKTIAKSLPMGTSKSQVIAFLASKKIDYSERRAAKSGLPDVLAGQTKNPNQIDALIPGHNWFSLYTYSVHITFSFDDADRLIDSKVDVDSYCDCL